MSEGHVTESVDDSAWFEDTPRWPLHGGEIINTSWTLTDPRLTDKFTSSAEILLYLPAFFLELIGNGKALSQSVLAPGGDIYLALEYDNDTADQCWWKIRPFVGLSSFLGKTNDMSCVLCKVCSESSWKIKKSGEFWLLVLQRMWWYPWNHTLLKKNVFWYFHDS